MTTKLYNRPEKYHDYTPHTSAEPYPWDYYYRLPSNAHAGKAVAERRNFRGSSMYGANVTLAGHRAYVVYSFATPILAWVEVGSTTYLWANECTHSSFTSRHRSHAMFGGYQHRANNVSGLPTYAFGHLGRRGRDVWHELAMRVALVHGTGPEGKGR